MTNPEIISRLDRIIALLELLAQDKLKAMSIEYQNQMVLIERGMPSHHKFAPQPIEALSPDYLRQLFPNENKL